MADSPRTVPVLEPVLLQEEVLETKAQDEAIRVYTVAKGHGEDAWLSAEEIIRRGQRTWR